MNSKSRLIISLSAFISVVIFGLVISLTWFLYLRYAIFTNINGQLKANRVYGDVVANAIFAGQIYKMTAEGDPYGSTKIHFNGNEVNETKKLCVSGDKVFNLSPRFNYVVLEYKFSNLAPNDEWLISLYAEFADRRNVSVTSSYFADEGITDYSLIDNEYNNDFIKSLPVATNGDMFVYLKFQIIDDKTDANFEANLIWTLNSRKFLNENS